jgi:Spy/CpxP family protein refolding chaperone
MTRTWMVLALIAIVAVPPRLVGQQPKPDDVFARALFDPQLVLRHAQAIGLTPTQRRQILDEMKTVQIALAPLQIDMAEPALELGELLENTRVDEAKAMAKIDQVLRIENEVKKKQAQFVIRVKNLLTPEQQTRLRALRDAESKDGGLDGSAPPTH